MCDVSRDGKVFFELQDKNCMENFNNPKSAGGRAKVQLFTGFQFPLPALLFLSGFGFQLLCGFLLVFKPGVALGCPAYVFRAGKFVEEMSAGDVFIRFAETHIGEHWAEVMDSQMTGGKRGNWKTAILSSTRRWSPEQAEEFFNIFQERLGAHGALRLSARSFSHLENLIPHQILQPEPVFQAIKTRIAYYDSYIGKEKTTERLFNSLDGFIDRDIDRTRELTRFLESYYGSKDPVVQIIERGIGVYSKTGRKDIEPIMLFLDKHTGRPALIEITLRDKREKKGYLSLGKLKNLQKTVRVLIDEVIPPSPESDKTIKEGLLALMELQGNSLMESLKMAQFLKSRFGENLVAEIMNKDLKSFAHVTPWMDYGRARAKIFDKYLGDRQKGAEFIKTHYRKLFSDSDWENFVKNTSRFGSHQPWKKIWD